MLPQQSAAKQREHYCLGLNNFNQLKRTQGNNNACALYICAATLLPYFLSMSPASGQTPAHQPGNLVPPIAVAPIAVPAAPAAAASPSVPVNSLPDTTDTSGDVAPQMTGTITQIILKGNSQISTPAILAVMAQKIGDSYIPANADKDRDNIKGMGYFNGDVGLTVISDPVSGLDLTYTVVENPVLTKIIITANTPTKEPTIPAAKLRALMTHTHDGQVLNTNSLNTDLDFLFNHETGYCRSQGYVFEVSSDINFNPQNGVLTIPIIEAYISSIKVTNNKKTKAKVVLRELRSKPGDVLNEKDLQKDLVKVFNLQIFDTVGPFEEIPGDPGLVAISIPVTEKHTGSVTVGLGYSSQSKLVGRAGLADTNFRGLGERASIQWEVGDVSSTSSVDLSFTEPYLDRHHTAMDIDLYDKAVYRFSSSTFGGTSGSNGTYTEQHAGGTIDFRRPFGNTLSGAVSFRSETVRTNNVTLPSNASFIRQDGSITGLGTSFSDDTRDYYSTPAEGGLSSLGVEFATSNTSTVNNAPTPLLPGTHTFIKTSLDLRRYLSLQGPRKFGDIKAPKKVFAVHLLLAGTQKEIPFSEEYFVGGADSLRGFDTDRYWGNNLALFQAELRLPIGKSSDYQVVLLTDAGDAWGSIYQGAGLVQNQKFSPQGDYGVGVRLNTPVGPIRLDYAIGNGSGKTQFSIGPSF